MAENRTRVFHVTGGKYLPLYYHGYFPIAVDLIGSKMRMFHSIVDRCRFILRRSFVFF